MVSSGRMSLYFLTRLALSVSGIQRPPNELGLNPGAASGTNFVNTPLLHTGQGTLLEAGEGK